VVPGTPHRLKGPGGLPGTAQYYEQISSPDRRGDGIPAVIDRETQMHEPHAEATKDVARSSLGRKEGASSVLELSDQPCQVAIPEPFQHHSVFLEDHREMLLDPDIFGFLAIDQTNR